MSGSHVAVWLKDKNATGRFIHSLTNRRCPMQTNEFQEQVSFRDDEQTASGLPI